MPYADPGKREAYNQEYRSDVIMINMRKLGLDDHGKEILREEISRAVDRAIIDQRWRSGQAHGVLKPERQRVRTGKQGLGRK